MKRQLSFENEKELMLVGKALASEIRIRILKLLDENPLCVNEIAEILQIPPSSAALNVRVLEEAGLIRTELKPGVRGSKKLCIRQNEELVVHLQQAKGKKHEELISMPVGNYVDYKITPTCGMVNDEEYIDGEDEPRCFYDPRRTTAKLVWFSSGYLEYRFPNSGIQGSLVKRLEISAELCSETADYDLDCPSDITSSGVSVYDSSAAPLWHNSEAVGARSVLLTDDGTLFALYAKNTRLFTAHFEQSEDISHAS